MLWDRTRRVAEYPPVTVGLDASVGIAAAPAAEVARMMFEVRSADRDEGFVPPEAEAAVVAATPPLDPRLTRSYLFLPVPEEALDGDHPVDFGSDEAATRIQGVLQAASSQGLPFTDVVVMSHGWHRNLFGAISAYDRLTSLFLDLRIRQRLDDPTPGSASSRPKRAHPFRLLLVGIHFHSDPGLDQFVDYSGRRDRESFLRNARERIEPMNGTTPGKMTSQFEDLFSLFSKVAAPGVDPFSEGMNDEAALLSGIVGNYALAGAPAGVSATPEEVLTVAWACYHEADTVQQTEEQRDPPGSAVGFWQWLARVGRLLVTVAAMAGILTSLMSGGLKSAWAAFAKWYAAGMTSRFAGLTESWAWVAFGVAVYVLLWLGLFAFVMFAETNESDGLDRRSRVNRQRGGTKLLGTILYAPLQLVHFAPVLLWCLITPFFASVVGVIAAALVGFFWTLMLVLPPDGSLVERITGSHWQAAAGWGFFWLLFALEIFRFGKAGYLSERLYKDRAGTMYLRTIQGYGKWPGAVKRSLVWFARAPINLAKRSARPDQAWTAIWTAVENQLAFWDMADKAVRAGGWIGDVVEKVNGLSGGGLRFHFFGHSHGGIVVCNAAAWLTRNDPKATAEVQTLGTINGAYRSDWLDGQTDVTGKVTGCVASIYSAYDVANSLWYPLANIGRKASGSVGLYLPQEPGIVGEPLPSIALSDAKSEGGRPDLAGRIEATGGDPAKAKVLNIDASRFVFRGPLLPQGAHGDVYSKDAVATMWRILRFGEWRR
ncbi:MAG TPA: hypothetical protein VHE55_01660 [Fimbriimonadaceae bacterium]|nr:hypothetical protein [Fimbriimonadaceae bacterium]